MKKLCVAVALLLTATSAHASSFSFKINGQPVRIDVPRNCTSLNCLSVTAPGLKLPNSNDDEPAPPRQSEPQAPVAPPPAPVNNSYYAPPPPAEPQQVQVPAPLPAPGPAPTVTTTAPTYEQPTYEQVLLPRPEPQPAPAPYNPAPTSYNPAPAPYNPTTVATTTPAPVVQQSVANSPLGTWRTEKNEGLVRIEECGANICGYSVNARTNQNGEKVLIDMRPAGTDKWKGRIHDTRNGGGGSYDSTIALRGDQLRVTGCAFGGMFCGGQTWTRMN